MPKDKPKPNIDYLRAAKANIEAPTDGLALEQYAGRAAAAQAQATIALVDELRTANLIAYTAFLNGSNGIDGYHPNAEQLTVLRDQIAERLGLS